jgi:hypothetical protein
MVGQQDSRDSLTRLTSSEGPQGQASLGSKFRLGFCAGLCDMIGGRVHRKWAYLTFPSLLLIHQVNLIKMLVRTRGNAYSTYATRSEKWLELIK